MPSRHDVLGCTAVLVCHLCASGIAAAQEPAPATGTAEAQTEPAEAKRRKAAEEEIVVTGSRVRRKDLTTPAPITVISREQVQASGKVSIGDFLQSLPEQGNAINTSVNNGGDGATRVNLRGLGVARTLVLLNGRRFVPGGTGANSSVDLNSIPTGAIERIEVLKDGASAVYGSDAIAGVINLITRKKYNGAEASGYLGSSTHADGQIYDLNAVAGTSGSLGNFIFTGGYYQQKAVFAGDRTFPGSSIPVAYTATGGLISQGSTTVPAGTFVLRSTQIGQPVPNPNSDPRIAAYNRLVQANPNDGIFIRDTALAGCDPTNAPYNCYRPLTSAALSPAGDGYNFQPENYLITPQQRISLFSTGDTRLGNSARAYVEGSYVNRQSRQRFAAEPLIGDSERVVVSRDNFYNPFGVDLTGVRRRLLEFNTRNYAQDIDTFRVVGGLDGTLPDEAGPLKGWYWDVSINFGRSEATQVKTGNLRRSTLQAALGPTFFDSTGTLRCGTAAAPIANCVPLNLFGGGDPPTITPDQITNLTFTGNLRGINQMTSVNLNTAGELFRLLADRPVGLAVGYEYRFLVGENIPDPITVAGDTTGNKGDITKGHYYINEGYGELSLPIANNMPGVENLEATAAARVFNYSTFGTDVTYKLGARWTLVRDFTVRGTYSTGFRAPSISDLFLGNADSFPPGSDPCRGAGVAGWVGPIPQNCLAQGIGPAGTRDAQTQLRTRIGGNPDLKPETSKMFTTGVVFEPRWVRNLSMTVDYYNIVVDQSITQVGASTILAGCYPTDPTQAPRFCDKVQRDASGTLLNVINTNTNVGRDATDGVDIALNYALPTEYGRFGFIFDGTWLHKFNRTLADGTLVRGKGNFDLNNQGSYGVYPTFKFISGVRWSFQGLDLGVSTRFLSAFTECGTRAGVFNGDGLCYVDATNTRRVSPYNTWDVFASYAFATPAGRTTVGAGVTNLFNRDPAIIYNGFLAATDPSSYADGMMGRFFYGRVAQSF